jgi:sugar transferase (PEP-CTERM system associated)
MRRIFGHYVATSWVLFGAVEAALVGGGFALAFVYAFSTPGFSPVRLAAFAMVLSLCVVALMHSGGLYQGDAVLSVRRTLWRVGAIAVPIFMLAVWTTGALAGHTDVPIYPYRWQWTGLLTAAWLLMAIVLRLGLREIYRSGMLTRRIMLIGRPSRAAELAGLGRDADARFRIVAQLDPDTRSEDICADGSLPGLAAQARASEIVVAIDGEPLPWKLLLQCRLCGIRVTDYLDFYEREGRRIRIDGLRDDWIVLSRGFEYTVAHEKLRRLLDIIVATVGVIATAPVAVLAALAVKLEDGGPVLFRQERVGVAGRPFMLVKFRSMRVDAERDGTPVWASERDHRITRVGRFIRKLRIDELPQFWNVLRGDMAMIGPRPERPYFARQFSETIPFYDYRHSVRPGLTGWAQVSFRYGASLEDTRRKLSYDLYYIKNRGLLLDLVILLKTVGVVLRGEGAR